MAIVSIILSNPLVSGFIATISGGGIIEYLRRRRQQKREAQKWYAEASGYLSNLQQAAQKATAYRDGVDHASLHENLDGLDEEMMRLANDSKKRVDGEAQIELAVIAAYVTGLASLTQKSSDTDALDFIKRVQSDAIKNYDGEYEMDDLESLFSGFDFEEFIDEMDRDETVDEQMAERLRSRFNDESLKTGYPTTIDEALNIPIEEAKDAFDTEGFMSTVLDDSLEAFVEMVIGLTEDVDERMNHRHEQV